ncbi:RidA family protein [Conexibacter stalactiti]|uniref:RidA family protein n=1 Tax=Conexibacter stalactiti TaxID=1940611 RepID=A0ABU4HHV5_9ACTN|nr:RidA family protein [Conexibacter stalactiti]MDW5592857.1 RidA family protein [Conexibacter stalactiti]MEC5033498.1 RidA family protein [Conexibacter stalactiti]
MKQAVDGGSPTGAYSPGVIAEGRFVHVSGQGPLADGAYRPGTIEQETALTLRNLEAILVAAGASLADVVKCGVFLRAIDDFAGMDAAYRAAFAGAEVLPARTTVGGQELAFGIKVEIDAVAVLR